MIAAIFAVGVLSFLAMVYLAVKRDRDTMLRCSCKKRILSVRAWKKYGKLNDTNGGWHTLTECQKPPRE